MAGVITNPPTQDHRAIIQFLSAEGCKLVEVNWRMAAVYEANCSSKINITGWSRMFRGDFEKTTDLPRPDQTHRVATHTLIADIVLFRPLKNFPQMRRYRTECTTGSSNNRNLSSLTAFEVFPNNGMRV